MKQTPFLTDLKTESNYVCLTVFFFSPLPLLGMFLTYYLSSVHDKKLFDSFHNENNLIGSNLFSCVSCFVFFLTIFFLKVVLIVRKTVHKPCISHKRHRTVQYGVHSLSDHSREQLCASN